MDKQTKKMQEYLKIIHGNSLFKNITNLQDYYQNHPSASDKLSQLNLSKIENQLISPLNYYMSETTKHARTLIALIIADTLEIKDTETILLIGRTIELFHNSSLLIDDIQDKALTRRGQPSAHLVYGVDNTINSGCFSIFFTLDFFFGNLKPQFSDSKKLKIHQFFLQMLLEAHVGNAYDLMNHKGVSETTLLSLKEYEKGVIIKTSSLMILILKLVELIFEIEKSKIESLLEILTNVALGFQIINDLAAVEPDNEQFGLDFIEKKLSYPMCEFLEHEKNEKIRSRFLHLFNQEYSKEVGIEMHQILEKSIENTHCTVKGIETKILNELEKNWRENESAQMFAYFYEYMKIKVLGIKKK